MGGKVFLSGVVLLLIGIVSISGRPQDDSKVSGLSTSTVSSLADGVGSSTVSPQEESKISKFFDDVSSVFKTGTAKVKESFENAATSVKDGVMRGYDYVKDKLTGNGDPTIQATVVEVSSSKPETGGDDSKSVSVRSTGTVQAAAPATTTAAVSTTTGSARAGTARAVNVEPNDEEASDDGDRVVFVDNEDTDTDSPVAPTTTAASSTTKKSGLDDRFIIDGPMACKAGQTAVNGKCRNTI